MRDRLDHLLSPVDALVKHGDDPLGSVYKSVARAACASFTGGTPVLLLKVNSPFFSRGVAHKAIPSPKNGQLWR